MLNTSYNLINANKIETILKELVQESFNKIKDEPELICLECCDIDLFVVSSYHLEFEEEIKKNFSLDEFGEIIDDESYRELMYDLQETFIELHKNSDLFDYFPADTYLVNGEKRKSYSDTLAPTGIFFAPFEDCIKN